MVTPALLVTRDALLPEIAMPEVPVLSVVGLDALVLAATDPLGVATLLGLLIVSLSIHEFGHSWTATRLGDPTSARLGRLTLNPLAHIDWMFSVVVPGILLYSGSGILFGAGKPVPVNLSYLRHPHRDHLLIASAGPAMNIVLAGLLTATAWSLGLAGLSGDSSAAWVIHIGIQLNLLLAVFNMLPVPPLDGHRVLGFFLPDSIREQFYRMHWLGLVLLLALFTWEKARVVFEVTLVPLSRAWGHYLMPGNWPYTFFPGF